MNQRVPSKRNLGIAAAALLLLIAVLGGTLFLSENYAAQTQTAKPTPAPTPTPFDYHLDVSPSNSTVMQGNSVKVDVTISYVLGSPENVTLNAPGIPSGAACTFSQQQGAPSSNSTFHSILTIQVPEAVPTNTYNITINATAENGKTHSSQYTLSVLAAKVSVAGTVSEGSKTPIQIIFEQLSPSGATVQTFTAPIQSGNYAISLPNKQFYAVSVAWNSYDGSSGIHHYILPYGVDAGVGVNSVNCPFSSS